MSLCVNSMYSVARSSYRAKNLHILLCRPPMSLSGLTGLATSTNAAYETMKGREKQNISNYDLAVQGHPPPQPQRGAREYEVPGEQFLPPAVAPSQDRERGTQEEAVYEPMPGK